MLLNSPQSMEELLLKCSTWNHIRIRFFFPWHQYKLWVYCLHYIHCKTLQLCVHNGLTGTAFYQMTHPVEIHLPALHLYIRMRHLEHQPTCGKYIKCLHWGAAFQNIRLQRSFVVTTAK